MNPASIVVASVNALWQGLTLIAIAALILRMLRRTNAATACAVWTATFVVVAALPILDLATQRSFDVAMANKAVAGLHNSRVAILQDLSVAAARTIEERVSYLVTQFGVLFLEVWIGVALLFLVALAKDCAALRALKGRAVPCDRAVLRRLPASIGHRRVRVCRSDGVRVPCVAGFFRPMILVPSALEQKLSDEDLSRIVLHEMGHIARLDDWLNFAERVMRAIFFFQPALWYAASRIGFEREIACDDFALAATGDPVRYAECLTNILERLVKRGSVLAVPGFLLGRRQVAERIARLVDRQRDGSIRVPFVAGVAVAAVLAVAVPALLRVQVPLLSAGHAKLTALAPMHDHRRRHVVIALEQQRFPQATLARAHRNGHGHCRHHFLETAASSG